MEFKWREFDPKRWRRRLPPERKDVLLCLAAQPENGLPASVGVGYLRYGAGQRDSPFFVIPGIGGTVTHWCDCLGEDFKVPCWPLHQQPTFKNVGRGIGAPGR